MFSKNCVFNIPPIEYDEGQGTSKSSLASNVFENFQTNKDDVQNYLEGFNNDTKSKSSYKGWQHLSSVIFSKNYHKINFLKNWRRIYQQTNKKGE